MKENLFPCFIVLEDGTLPRAHELEISYILVYRFGGEHCVRKD